MKRRYIIKVCALVVFAVCSLLIAGTGVTAAENFPAIKHPDKGADAYAYVIKTLNIISDQAILEGETQQMQVEEFSEYVLLDSVKWSSSKPDVIACTKDGKIKGLQEGKAIITVEAKVGKAKDSVTVYCARKLSKPDSAHISQVLAYTCRTPNFFHFQDIQVYLPPFIMTKALEVKGVYGSYFYVTSERETGQAEGFILQSWMPNNIASDEIFKQLSEKEIVVFCGESSSKKLTTNFKESVVWEVSDSNIISFSSSTGVITAKKPGIAIISATSRGKTLGCMVFSVSRWCEPEITKTTKEIKVKSIPVVTGKVVATLPRGTQIVADGDLENGSGWIHIISEDVSGFIQVSDFPGIDYLMTQYHYYDQGFDIRFGSARTKIYDYASVLNDVMMANFKLKVCPYVDSYTSAADQCKIWRYGSVATSNLYAICSQNGKHKSNSCLAVPTAHETLVAEKGIGTDVIGKCLWTGHVLEPHTTSMTSLKYQTIVFTICNFTRYIPSTNTYDNLTDATIERLRLYEIVHETSHHLSAKDHYCYGKTDSVLCTNPYCELCYGSGTVPYCIMGKTIYPTDTYDLYCEKCVTNIENHLKDHH